MRQLVISAGLVPASDRGGAAADAAAEVTSAASPESISFASGDEQYGVAIMAVREIKEWSNVRHLPKRPEYVRGVLNPRGVTVPIVDLRCRRLITRIQA